MGVTILDSSCKWNQVIFVFISLGAMSSRLIHVVANDMFPLVEGRMTFQCVYLYLSISCLCHTLSFCLSVGICFYILASVNSAVVNIRMQISLQDPAFNSFG